MSSDATLGEILAAIGRERRQVVSSWLGLDPDDDYVARVLEEPGLPVPRWKLMTPRVTYRRLSRMMPREFAAGIGSWHNASPLGHPFVYGPFDRIDTEETESANKLKSGYFSPHPGFDWEKGPVPPRWGDANGQRRDMRMYQNSLQWMVPLIKAAFGQNDSVARDLSLETVLSWIDASSIPPGRSTHAWHDHAVAIRTRVMAYLWEGLRQSRTLPEDSFTLLLSSICQHLEYLAHPENFNVRSNHGMEMAGSLIAGSYTMHPLNASSEWRSRGYEMLGSYLELAFSAEGFNREQSPSYQVFIMRRLAQIDGFLSRNGFALQDDLRDKVDGALAAFPHLVRKGRTVPAIGDSARTLAPNWATEIEDALGRPLPEPLPDSVANPRGDGASLVTSPGAGYAIFSSNRPGEGTRSDLHLVFKYNYFEYPHFHEDGLSFVLFWDGVEWLIDPGRFGYDWDRPERKFVRSAKAHNVLLLDGKEFEHWPVETHSAVRTVEGDAVSSTHRLDGGTHTRALGHRSDGTVLMWDHVQSHHEQSKATLYFHLAEDTELSISDDASSISASLDGRRLELTTTASVPGRARLVVGQTEPELQGWWSPGTDLFRQAPVVVCDFEFESILAIQTEMRLSQTR